MFSALQMSTMLVILAVYSSVVAYGQAKDIVQLVKKTKTAVVLITVKDAFGIERGQGTGFFVSSRDIITNHHVIKGAASVSVQTYDSTKMSVLRIVAIDTVNDLAMIRIDRDPGKHAGRLELNTAVPEIGERVYVIGSPLGLEQTVSDGIVASIRSVEGVSETIQFTAPISSGSSGSPLMNDQGKVIGVVRSTTRAGQNLNFASPSKTVQQLDTNTAVSFTTSTKLFMGKEMPLTEAIVVRNASKVPEPPPGLSTKEYNLWLMKSYVVRNGWDSTLIQSQGSRLIRLARRFADKDIEEDRLDNEDVSRIVEEAIGKKPQADTVSRAVYQKQAVIDLSLTLASRYVNVSGDASVVAKYTSTLEDQHQEIVYMTEGTSYVLVTVSDDCARDIDAALFRETPSGWMPVASDTDPDARPLVWYRPTETGRYAIVWKLARKWRTCDEVVFGALLLSSSD